MRFKTLAWVGARKKVTSTHLSLDGKTTLCHNAPGKLAAIIGIGKQDCWVCYRKGASMQKVDGSRP